MKAELCVEGARRTYDYCREKGIPFRQVGKLIVAVDESEIANLKIIYDRAVENKVVGVEWLDTPEAIQEVESHCAGLKAVLCRSTGEGVLVSPLQYAPTPYCFSFFNVMYNDV